MRLFPDQQHGYIALIAVLIITGVTLAISITLNLSGIQESRSGLLLQQTQQAQALADSCLDEAYLRVKRNSNYTGSVLNIADGSCTITVVPAGLLNIDRIITAEATYENISRVIESRIRRNIFTGSITVLYWQDQM